MKQSTLNHLVTFVKYSKAFQSAKVEGPETLAYGATIITALGLPVNQQTLAVWQDLPKSLAALKLALQRVDQPGKARDLTAALASLAEPDITTPSE
jgi:hypothetical protein